MAAQQTPADSRRGRQQGREQPESPLLGFWIATDGKQGAVGLDHRPLGFLAGPSHQSQRRCADQGDQAEAEGPIGGSGEKVGAQASQQQVHLSAP